MSISFLAETVALLLSHRAILPNGVHPPGSGTTALHLASALGRVDVVSILLEQDGIDDSLRDRNGKTCREVAKGKDVIKAIEGACASSQMQPLSQILHADSRSFLNASFRSLLHTYILSPPNTEPDLSLIALLNSPRIRFVHLSYLDNDFGTSLLHEAAKRKDLRLIELAVRAGADVFVRDRKGKMAYDGTGKDDRVKVFLRQREYSQGTDQLSVF
jgi:ankyrin repeat protein